MWGDRVTRAMSKICCISTSFLQDHAKICRDPTAGLGPPPMATLGLAQPLTCTQPCSRRATSSPPSPSLIFRPKLQLVCRRETVGGAGQGAGLSQGPAELPPAGMGTGTGTGTARQGHPRAAATVAGDVAFPSAACTRQASSDRHQHMHRCKLGPAAGQPCGRPAMRSR